MQIKRCVYAQREGQKIEFAAVDARLALPESKFSYLLQDWDQDFAMEHVDEEGNEIDGRPAIFGWISEDVAQRRGDRARPLVHITAGQESLWNMRDVFQRMRYDEYLAAGNPIASGVSEGACRHVVKDRMERAGMNWVVAGAQAMLDLRCIYLCDAWDEFVAYRIEQETERLYPYRDSLQPISVSLAA